MEKLLHHDDADSIFSRIVLVNDISPILDKEHQDLSEGLVRAQASSDLESIPYLEDAMKSLQERRLAFIEKQEESKQSASSAVRDGGSIGRC